MIHTLDDCRVVPPPNASLPSYRGAVESAIGALERAYGLKLGKPYALTAQQSANLKRLHRLRMALHEGY